MDLLLDLIISPLQYLCCKHPPCTFLFFLNAAFFWVWVKLCKVGSRPVNLINWHFSIREFAQLQYSLTDEISPHFAKGPGSKDLPKGPFKKNESRHREPEVTFKENLLSEHSPVWDVSLKGGNCWVMDIKWMKGTFSSSPRLAETVTSLFWSRVVSALHIRPHFVQMLMTGAKVISIWLCGAFNATVAALCLSADERGEAGDLPPVKVLWIFYWLFLVLLQWQKKEGWRTYWGTLRIFFFNSFISLTEVNSKIQSLTSHVVNWSLMSFILT